MTELDGIARHKNYAKLGVESAAILAGCVCLYEALKFSLALIVRADTPEESEFKARCLVLAFCLWPLAFSIWTIIFWVAHKRKVIYNDQPSDSPSLWLNVLCLAIPPLLVVGNRLLNIALLILLLFPIGLCAIGTITLENTPRVKDAGFCFLLSGGLTLLSGVEAAIAYQLLYGRH